MTDEDNADQLLDRLGMDRQMWIQWASRYADVLDPIRSPELVDEDEYAFSGPKTVLECYQQADLESQRGLQAARYQPTPLAQL